MSVAHLPARTEADPHQPEIHVFWDEPTAGAVLDETDVHRDRTQDAADAATAAAVAAGAVAALANAFSPYTLLNQALIGVTVVLVVAAAVLRWAVAREGRRWVYATDTDPA